MNDTSTEPSAPPKLVWITTPDNYDPSVQERLQREGSERVDMLRAAGFDVRIAHSCDIVPAWNGRPRLLWRKEDLLAEYAGFLVTSWSWDPAVTRHLEAITRTIRASDCVLLTDGTLDPEVLGLDKLAMYHHAAVLGAPVLPTVSVPFGRYARRALDAVGTELPAGPYVVKPRSMAMGFGVLKADTAQHLSSAIDLLTPGGLGCLIQPHVPNDGDVRVYVHERKVIAALLREPTGEAYLANVSQGGSGSGYEPPAEVVELSERLARSLESDYLCVDWLVTDGGHVFNEWMTVSAAYEDLPDLDRQRVADALVQYIRRRLDEGAPRPL
ncbi:ATP-grasp domain-containing protein [Streptomyces sp. LMG1-1-1.1]|uniref:ATP-grasp domain-containing protein n=1 Tax=Streptomyces sp. LMG1-1-1.1 TaxID=3135245 RepID=UPI003465121E